MSSPEENSFVFPRVSMFQGNIEIRGKTKQTISQGYTATKKK
jgi:hypothetical protein